MTQEEKELLVKDLCARLPYYTELYSNVADGNWAILTPVVVSNLMNADKDLVIKPYLRPMSSMTEKEQRYIWDKYGPSFLVADFEDAGDVSELFNYCQMNISRAPSFVDWLNEHHFDYRGLIEKGLALEAPADMYKSE